MNSGYKLSKNSCIKRGGISKKIITFIILILFTSGISFGQLPKTFNEVASLTEFENSESQIDS